MGGAGEEEGSERHKGATDRYIRSDLESEAQRGAAPADPPSIPALPASWNELKGKQTGFFDFQVTDKSTKRKNNNNNQDINNTQGGARSHNPSPPQNIRNSLSAKLQISSLPCDQVQHRLLMTNSWLEIDLWGEISNKKNRKEKFTWFPPNTFFWGGGG